MKIVIKALIMSILTWGVNVGFIYYKTTFIQDVAMSQMNEASIKAMTFMQNVNRIHFYLNVVIAIVWVLVFMKDIKKVIKKIRENRNES